MSTTTRAGLIFVVMAVETMTGCSGQGNAGNAFIPASGGVGGDGGAQTPLLVGQDPPNGTGTGTGMDAFGDSGSAQDTTDGLQPISPAAAAALQNPEAVCAGWSESAKAQPSVLEFIIDVSGTMREETPATDGDSKWKVTRAALAKAMTLLPDSTAVGLAFFPNKISDNSDVPLPPTDCINTEDDVPIAALSSAQRNALAKALEHVEPKTLGATPTHDAFTIGLSQLQTTTVQGARYAVLITDGQPTLAQGCMGVIDPCAPSPTAPIVQAIGDARAQVGVRTFVVGSPGSEANVCTGADSRGWLSAAARGGGTGTPGCTDQKAPYCHFDLGAASDFGQGLATALETIAGTVVSCAFDVPSPPPGETIDPARTNLVYDDGAGVQHLILPYTDNGSECDRGWRFSDATSKHIDLCGRTCDLVKRNPNAKVDLLFGCQTGSITPVK